MTILPYLPSLGILLVNDHLLLGVGKHVDFPRRVLYNADIIQPYKGQLCRHFMPLHLLQIITPTLNLDAEHKIQQWYTKLK